MSVRGDIIDHMLTTLGEGGVSYEASLHPTVQICTRVLRNADREFQSIGWWFNREHRVPLSPDNRGEILLPTETLSVTVSTIRTPEAKQRFVRRDGKLYDNVRHTNNFGSIVHADLVVQLDFDDLPPIAASYLMHKAAEDVFLSEDGDAAKLDKLETKTARAWQTLKATEMREVGLNALDAPASRGMLMGVGPSYSRNPNLIGGR